MILILADCAKRGTPSGGPEDEDPPVLLSAEPKQETTNFKSKHIRLTFDEYIKLNDLQKQLIVSPPMDPAPTITPQGSASKYLDIEITDTLQPNTTYVINFGQSVQDNHEGNPYPFFKYIFSTGDYIDTLKVEGRIRDAYNKEAAPYVNVMLYDYNEEFNDSTIYNVKPTYITNTLDSTTAFEITNVKPGKYKLIALKEESPNYMYNRQTDKLAFYEDVITVPTDTTYELSLFKEVLNYRATKPALVAKNRIVFGYEGDSTGMKINLLSDKPDDFTSRIIPDKEIDTLHYWFTPFEADSLIFTVAKNEQFIDTFTVRIKELYNDSLKVTPNFKGAIPPNKRFKIAANTPLSTVNNDSIKLINQDSVAVPFSTSLDKYLNEVTFDFETKENQRYILQLLPGTVKDMFEKTNDTLQYSFKQKKYTDYGTIIVKLQGVKSFPIIVQLTDKNGNVKEEQFAATEENTFYFSSIEPSTYFLRVIYDTNGNKKWDTGDYFEKIQPERMFYYPESIELRANWEFEQQFILN
ncbi:Ig-like domain-containing domain [Pustulibacterium marinum]|uniref:Ig-like domain-containing domain n=1 Tax=Pustulibacterium marinum TaxID=1224947 RepID=UPI001FEAE0D2|nr:Ig-like domain-containing domain [Pustulibacterium marinum]